MALQDILDAITVDADRRIADARAASEQRLKHERAQSRQRIADRKTALDRQLEAQKAQLRSKAETHGAVAYRNVLLGKKRELIDRLYGDVLNKLAGLPEDAAGKWLRASLASAPAGGTIHPSKAHAAVLKKLAGDAHRIGPQIDAVGGFIYRSADRELDFTLEHLVREELRPRTEVTSAASLFASK